MAKTTITTNIGSASISSTQTRTQEDERVLTITLPAGKSGTLSTRTDDDTGIVAVASGHGITASDTVAVFWDGGVQYNVDVTATDGTTISIDLGDGDNLPIATTAVVIAKQLPHVAAFAGDSLEMLAIGCRNRCSIEFFSSVPASLLHYEIEAGEGRHWVKSTDTTNPLAGDAIATLRAANGGTSEVTLQIGLLLTTD
jgi:hypothetical protein